MITKEQLSQLYTKTMNFCMAKYGQFPEDILIIPGGDLEAMFVTVDKWDHIEPYESIKLSDLELDLKPIYDERKRLEEEKKKQEEIKRKQIEEERINKLKEERL